MKKQIGLAVASLAALVLLGACGSDDNSSSSSSSSAAESSSTVASTSTADSSSTAAEDVTYQDGEYRVEAAEFSHDYKEYVVLTITDGKIADVEFDAFDKDNNLKSADADYKESMEATAGTYPEKYMKELAESLKETQAVDSVEAVTGATSSTTDFKKLAQAALDYAAKGETGTHTLELPSEE